MHIKKKKKKSWYNGQSFANGTESGIYVQIVSQNTITSEPFIILWGIESPNTILGDPMWCSSLSSHLHQHPGPFNFYLPRAQSTLHYLGFVLYEEFTTNKSRFPGKTSLWVTVKGISGRAPFAGEAAALPSLPLAGGTAPAHPPRSSHQRWHQGRDAHLFP